jgi:hypothetical protein
MEKENFRVLEEWKASNREGQRTFHSYPEGSTRHQTSYSYATVTEVLSGHALQVPGREINIMGVVTDWEEPRKTRGPDLMTSLKIADLTGVVEIRVFARTIDSLPRPRNIGDIFRLHRGTLSVYTRNVEGEGSISKSCVVASLSKSRASWTLFFGDAVADKDNKDEFKPYGNSHERYTMSIKCMSLIDLLRNFSRNGTWRASAMGLTAKQGEEYRRMIKSAFTTGYESMNHTFCDLVVLVVAVEHDSYHSHHGKTIVWVWDGTNAPPYPPNVDTRFPKDRVGHNEMTLDQIEIEQLMEILYRKTLDMKLVKSCPPPFGTIVPILFPSTNKAFDLHDPPVGYWIKIRNVGFTIVDSQLQGFFTHNTKYQMWRVDDEKMYESSLVEPRGPMSGCKDIEYGQIRSTVLENIRPVSNVRDVLWRARDVIEGGADEHRECEFFRCRVRIMTIWPGNDNLSSICIPRITVPEDILESEADNDDEWLFACRFTLEDPTGSLEADLFGREGAYFFSDIVSPCDLSDSDNRESLEKLRSTFIALQNSSETRIEESSLGIWLDVCIFLYWPSENEPHYRIFGTKLLNFDV